MVLLKIKIDNVYMFDQFEVDFTYPKKLVNSPIEYEYLSVAPKINYKKINIIMGSNASGKTTFGKLLCNMQNFLIGKKANFLNLRNNIEKKGTIYMMFVIDDLIFEYYIEFDDKHINEKIKKIKLFKSYNLDKAIRKLDDNKFLEEFYEFDLELPTISKLCLTKTIYGDVTYSRFFKEKMWFYYRFASFTEKSDIANRITDDLLLDIEKCLKVIDPSIKSVRKTLSRGLSDTIETYDENGYYIIFNNGDRLLVDQGNIRKTGYRLSQGTIETVELAEIMRDIRNYSFIYLDEQMAYMHTTLSNQIILKLLEDMERDSQLFITTHNENALDLNIPIHSYVFFVRENDNIKVIHPEKTLKKNDRRLIEYVQNNYFDTNPDLDNLWDIGIVDTGERDG